MKVLIISEYFPPKAKGGGEFSSYLLAKYLARNKVDVSVLTSHFKGLKKYEIYDGIKIYRELKTGENPKSFIDNIKRIFVFENSLKKELIKLDKKEDFDIIHCMNITTIPAIKVKPKLKKKFVVHINSPLPFCPKGNLIKNERVCNIQPSLKECYKCMFNSETLGKVKNRFFIRYNPLILIAAYNKYKKNSVLLKRFDHYVGASHAMVDLLIKMGLNPKKMDVVWNIMEKEPLIKKEPEKNKIPRLLYVGDYLESKGIYTLVNALKGIKLDYEIGFYGSGTLKDKMLAFIKKNKINAKVNDQISSEKLKKIYAQTDVVLFPTLCPEGFGRIPVEGMIAEKPVIASGIGGVKDIVEHKKTGLVVEPGNVKELRGAIEFLIKNPRTRLKFGKNGRREVLKKFNGNNIAKKMIKIYKKLFPKRWFK